MKITFDKGYEFKLVEQQWYQRWNESGCFSASAKTKKPPFCVVIPPPNVTGSLHMGHALNNTLQDVLIRFKRMDGFNALWIPGTDHAGIATQNVVEKQLAAKGIQRDRIGREAFIEQVWRWKEQSGNTILSQQKRLGISCDWQRLRFTMDEGLSAAVRRVFITLYEEGLIYRGNYIINWCPRCKTALSDLEVTMEPSQGKLWHIRYPILDSTEALVIATTRPETMLGDTAVAVNPSDERYQKWVGKKVKLPITGRIIPIIADEAVKADFGTGALKITPAHDFNDFETGKRHELESITVLDDEARVDLKGSAYHGMSVNQAREAVLKDLASQGFLVKEEVHSNMVGGCYRCRTVVQPRISKQWFVKAKELAKPALQAVVDGRTKITPKAWEKTYFEWLENIRDWCISRQIWWGHRIPAWTCLSCQEVVVAEDPPLSCDHCGGKSLRQETDVLDTWFSSALWPFSTLGWPAASADLKTFYPTSVLVTGFDILFFWVARMMMMGLKFMKEVPFKEVCIHALVRDEHGQKMSKSKGNVIDPLEIMDEYGTDAFRFALVALTVQGRDILLSEDRINGYRNFVNKVWNASRFAAMMIEQIQEKYGIEVSNQKLNESHLTQVDRWINSELDKTIKAVRLAYDEMRFNDIAQELYHFTWHQYCDWYIELSKTQLQAEPEAAKDPKVRAQIQASALNLLRGLETILKLLNPIMPFVTEEIWQKIVLLTGKQESDYLMLASFPKAGTHEHNEVESAEIELMNRLITTLRTLRAENGLPPGKKVEVLFKDATAGQQAVLQKLQTYLHDLGKVAQSQFVLTVENIKGPTVSTVVDGITIILPIGDLIDVGKERQRLEKQIAKLKEDLARVEQKLGNPNFVNGAPAAVVEEERRRLTDFKDQQEKLTAFLSRLGTA